MSYMNHSGDAVRSVADFYKLPLGSVLVAYDELDFPAGGVRLRQGGGAAGHHCLPDGIAHLGDAVWRTLLTAFPLSGIKWPRPLWPPAHPPCLSRTTPAGKSSSSYATSTEPRGSL